MGLIRILPEHVANKIAAGEVIERPASIVKELVENALDAGATSLEIEINHGGRSLIRVADNGRGMSPEDAELAFRRHATSKISGAEDLEHIASYGFRGEALPSIAAVARVRLVTRPADRSSATEILVEGGAMQGAREAPSSPGTIVEVRDLFFNTPARRKFLKTDSTELGHIMDAVSNFALARPDVRLVFKSSGRTVWDLGPMTDLLARAAAVLGEDSAKHMLKMETEANGIRLYGLVGKPFAARANRSGQTYFINDRWIRSIGLSHALHAGYHGLLMHGQYPSAVLFIEVDPERVDVNVHPTKQEVRISNEAEIKSLIRKAVTECLQQEGDLSPDLKSFKPQMPVWNQPVTGMTPKRDPVTLYSQELEAGRGAEPQVRETGVAAPVYAESQPEIPAAGPLISIRNKLMITKILGQIHNTFLVAETEEGFMIIDQHAAHERVMFEALIKNFETEGPVARQSLLMDEVLELHPRQVEILAASLPMLKRVGFDIEPFGEKAFVVRAYPAILEKEDPLSFLKAYVEEREEGKVKTRLEEHREEVAALIACKRQSVKAHDALTPLKIQTLLERLSACDNPFSCPHGRPVFFKKTFSELERQFKRK